LFEGSRPGSGSGGSSEKPLDKSPESGIINNKDNMPVVISMQFFANKNILKMNDNQLKKSIASWEEQVKLHESKIKSPEIYSEEWTNMTEQHKKGLINHWKHEIKTLTNDIQDATEELRKRGK